MGAAQVLSLNVVHADVPDVGGTVGVTAIDKRPVADRRSVTTGGVEGDHRCDAKHHGHPDQAVYAYASEDYAWWSAQLQSDLAPGAFGENLTTTGVDWNAATVGTIVRIGSAVLQVSSPRIPCGTFTRWTGQEQWVKRFSDARRFGAYLRVLEPGELGAGEAIEVIERPEHDVTVVDAARVYLGDREPALVTRVAACPDAQPETRDKARAALPQ
jgi:MOSC domain-containing protein YiiM